MIKRHYFIYSKVTEGGISSFASKTFTLKSWFEDPVSVYNTVTDLEKKELLERRPGGVYEVISFNRI